jgi:hypothetical protein
MKFFGGMKKWGKKTSREEILSRLYLLEQPEWPSDCLL